MITKEFRNKVRDAILINRENYPSITDAKYARIIGLSASIYSRLKKGETEKIASDNFWLEQGRKLDVQLHDDNWKVARTSVYSEIEENINFCMHHKKATMLIDEPGIGKSFCTRHIIRGMQNAFYVDCSQAPTKREFVRHLAKTLGVDNTGKVNEVKENLKYYINMIQPFIALDDAGYLDADVYKLIIEIWNATEGRCGWMMIGDDSLQASIEKGLRNKKIGYKALFSRFSEDFIHYVPIGQSDRQAFLRQLIGDVASANMGDNSQINKIIKRCIGKEKTLRYLDTLIKVGKEYE
jgi:hypothetical protein